MINRLTKKQSGFTLIEVLLAAFILFLVLTAMTMVYRAALISSEVANRNVALHQVVGFVNSEVKGRLVDKVALNPEQKGRGQFNQVDYTWSAVLADDKKGPSRLNVNSGDFEVTATRYQRWNVTIRLNKGKASKELSYRVFRWQEK